MSEPTDSDTPRRILVRAPNWLGDVVMTTPGLRALRARHPQARLVVLVPSGLAPLLEGSGLCDEVWSLASRDAGVRGWWTDARRIAAGRFDLGLVIPESISSALLMRMGRVGRIVGFARDPLRRMLLTHEVESPTEWGRRRMVSRERFVLRLVKALGFGPDAAGDADREGDVALTLAVTPAEEQRLSSALDRAGTSLEGVTREPPIVIAPGASFGDAKCWPAESYAELADRLIRRGESVVLLGAPGEHDRVEAVRGAMKGTAVVLDGVLDVGSLKALLSRARALVANDAGARHVAVAFGVPALVFFGPTSLAKTADNLGCIEVLETEHACRPCYRRQCPIDHRCLRSIGVDEAEAATQRALLRSLPVTRSSAASDLAAARHTQAPRASTSLAGGPT